MSESVGGSASTAPPADLRRFASVVAIHDELSRVVCRLFGHVDAASAVRYVDGEGGGRSSQDGLRPAGKSCVKATAEVDGNNVWDGDAANEKFDKPTGSDAEGDSADGR